MTIMKAKDKILSAVVLTAAALCTSCSTDDLTAQQQGQGETKAMSLTATLDGTQTRAGLNSGSDNTHTLYWHDSDQILVRTKSTADDSSEGVKFGIAEGTATGVTTATFNGLVSDKKQIDTYAVYPYDADHKFTDENSLTFHLPSEYEYTTVETGIFPKDGTYRTTSTHVPMLGTISDGTAKFKHLGGLLVIRIDQMPAESGTLTVSANEQLSGNFDVALSDDNPALVTAATETDADKKVTFTFSNATQKAVGVFYLPVATGSYSGVTIKVTCGETTQTINYGNLYVARKSVTAIPLYANGTDGALTKFSKIEGNVYTLNGHEFLDLGLDNGLLWATMNIGADKAEAAGSYFAWGETTPKTSFTLENYTAFTSDAEFPSTLDAAHDAATANWGAGVRMPTATEFEELLKGCTPDHSYTSEQVEEKNVLTIYGMTYTGKKDSYTSTTIYLPTAGMYIYDRKNYDGTQLIKDSGKNGGIIKGDIGTYWSSSSESNGDIKVLSFLEECFYVTESYPFLGCSVRAVTEK